MSEKSNAPEFSAESPELWDRVYREYSQLIRSYVAARLRSPQDVDDLVQNVFAALVRQKHLPENLRRYLYTTARNQLRLYWRQKKQRGSQAASLTPAEYALDMPSAADPLEEAYSEEQRRIVAEAIERLPAGLACVLRLRVIQGLSLHETAQKAGCSCDAAKKRLQRAKRFLLVHYEDTGERRKRHAE